MNHTVTVTTTSGANALGGVHALDFFGDVNQLKRGARSWFFGGLRHVKEKNLRCKARFCTEILQASNPRSSFDQAASFNINGSLLRFFKKKRTSLIAIAGSLLHFFSFSLLFFLGEEEWENDTPGWDTGVDTKKDTGLGHQEGHGVGTPRRTRGWDTKKDTGVDTKKDTGVDTKKDTGVDTKKDTGVGHGVGHQEGHGGGHQEGHRGGHQEGHRVGHQEGHGADQEGHGVTPRRDTGVGHGVTLKWHHGLRWNKSRRVTTKWRKDYDENYI
jgi:hypothetical protein